MNKLIRYDPEERILARQALKDPFFRELREADKDKVAASSAGANANSQPPSQHPRQRQQGMAGSTSTGSLQNASDADAPTNASEAGRSETPVEEKSNTLPNISQAPRQRKVGGGPVAASQVAQ